MTYRVKKDNLSYLRHGNLLSCKCNTTSEKSLEMAYPHWYSPQTICTKSTSMV